MANEGEFPKDDGDTFYGKDANIVLYQGMNSNVLHYDSVNVGSDATIVASNNFLRKNLLIKNYGNVSIWVGSSGVTTTSGYKIFPKQSITLYTKDNVYCIADNAIGSGYNDVRYLEVE